MKAYLAGSIFYAGDAYRNAAFSKAIRNGIEGIDLYNPLENTAINGPEGKKKCATSVMIAEQDNARLDNTDVLFACLDGDVIPAGTSAEIGRFSALPGDRLVIGILTDNRSAHTTESQAKDWQLAYIGENQYCYQNLYVIGLIKQHGVVVDNIMEAVRYAKEWGEHHGKC